MIGAGLIDRNDRKPLADWVRKRIHSQTRPPDVFIDSSHIVPSSNDVDIIPRVKFILRRAIEAGVDFLYLFENDDYYPRDYIERMEHARGDADFINSNIYVRYHIKLRHCQMIGHQKGAYKIGGLWTMGFRPEILNDYFWQRITDDTIRNLDSHISQYAQMGDIKNVWFNNHNGVAIKGHHMGLYKENSPHKAFNIPYVTDPEAVRLGILTDQSFMHVHGLPWKRYQKTNKELRQELKQIFPLWQDS